jgi:hypothetical protein
VKGPDPFGCDLCTHQLPKSPCGQSCATGVVAFAYGWPFKSNMLCLGYWGVLGEVGGHVVCVFVVQFGMPRARASDNCNEGSAEVDVK